MDGSARIGERKGSANLERKGVSEARAYVRETPERRREGLGRTPQLTAPTTPTLEGPKGFRLGHRACSVVVWALDLTKVRR